jgi:hypothetical protein
MSGPFTDLGAAVLTNTDPFSGRPIADPRDPPEKRTADRLNYVWRVMAPPWLTDRSFALRTLESYQQAPATYHGDPPLTMAQAVARAFGFNVYPVDPERSRETNLVFMRRGIEDARRRMRSRLRDQRLDEDGRRRLAERFQADIQRRVREMQDYERSSVVHPRLRMQSEDDDWVVPSAPPESRDIDFSRLPPPQ